MRAPRASRKPQLTARLSADIDPQLFHFLTEKINSFVKWDLARFFYENPHTTDTAQNIARYAGRSVEAVRAELAELARDGVLEESRLGNLTIYSLTSDERTRTLLQRLMESASDRQFRLNVLYHIIRGIR